MTPKEKAKELIEKYLSFVDWYDLQEDCTNREWAIRNAKQCALIAVDEIIEAIQQIFETFEERQYWQEVKNEIENL